MAVLVLSLAVVFGVAAGRTITTVPLAEASGAAATAESGGAGLIDPNTAPWWELTALPGVGEVTAKKIVEYRQARCEQLRGDRGEGAAQVFTRPADLQRVHGIGPNPDYS